MRSPALLLSSSPVVYPEFSEGPHSCTSSTLLGILVVSFLAPLSSYSQDFEKAAQVKDTSELVTTGIPVKKVFDTATFTTAQFITPREKKKRIWLVAGANAVGYGSAMIGLSSAWYKNYPKTGFHTFNDWPEWKQVDKVGHLYAAYIESYGSMELWRWTGIDRKKRIWIGGMSGAFYQTVIEVLDGFSAGWGWSWSDFGVNIIGSSTLVAQELAWNEQRIRLKFSWHRKKYDDPTLNQRSDVLFGKSSAERFIKDYNGQAYWASVNLRSFFPKSKLPRWFSVSVGYGADGMFGGTENIARDKDGNVIFNRTDIKRYRQWYLSPDIDLNKIKTKSTLVKLLLGALNAFKFPMPTLELSNGKLKGHLLYF